MTPIVKFKHKSGYAPVWWGCFSLSDAVWQVKQLLQKRDCYEYIMIKAGNRTLYEYYEGKGDKTCSKSD